MIDYDADILSWSEHQSALLRRVGAGESINDLIDWDHIAEEIESVGRTERSALASHVRTIIEHLAKLQTAPAVDPRNGWKETVIRARGNIEELLDASPSLRGRLEPVIRTEHPRAMRTVALILDLHGEAPRLPFEQIRYSLDDILTDWFPPDAD